MNVGLCLLLLVSLVSCTKSTYGATQKFEDEYIELDGYQNSSPSVKPTMSIGELVKVQEKAVSDTSHLRIVWAATSAIVGAISIGLGYYGRHECPEPCHIEHELETFTKASVISSLSGASLAIAISLIYILIAKGAPIPILGPFSIMSNAVIRITLLSVMLELNYPRVMLCDASIWSSVADLALVFLSFAPKEAIFRAFDWVFMYLCIISCIE